jgi:hypothetical protein
MDLVKARMSDEKGDRESAQRYFDSYQRNKRDAETYEIQRSKAMIDAQTSIVGMDEKQNKAILTAQLGLDRAQSKAETDDLRNQRDIAKLMGAGQPKAMTVSESLALKKDVNSIFNDPRNPDYLQYVGAEYKGGAKQLALDLQNKNVKPDDPNFQKAVNRARENYVRDFLGGTNRRSSSRGATPYDQAASDLLGQ